MRKPLLLGAILGGLAAFMWSMAWELLGMHEKTVHAFPNEAEVTAAISSHPTPSGVYLLPILPREADGMTPEQATAAKDAAMAQFQKGPIMFAAVRSGGFGSYPRAMTIHLLSQMLAAGLLTWMLQQTTALSYGRRVLFVGAAGLASSVIVDLPNWNWWGFSGPYTLMNFADFALMWLFAGLVIAKVGRPSRE